MSSRVYRQLAAPQHVGGVLDSAVGLFKAAFGAVLVLAVVAAAVRSVPYLIPTWTEVLSSSGVLANQAVDPYRLLAALTDSMIGVLVAWLIGIFLGMGVIAQMNAAARGGSMPWQTALVVAWRRLPATLGCCLVYVLVLALGFGLALLVGAVVIRTFLFDIPVAVIGIASGLVGMAVFMVAAIPLLVLFVRWCLALPLVVSDSLGPVAALRRSWHLVRGHWWHTLVIVSVAGFIVFVVATLVGLAGMLLLAATDGGLGVRTTVLLLNTVGGTITTPLFVASLLATLRDLELRRDSVGFAAGAANPTDS